ncbi:Cytochrome P450 [Colletotrichum higginsianum IMI 349063]|uniref:Cytochrome P450 n=2 Tax=Colletotrichum higginsianum TaxID=80884 RepID=A0A1B7XTH3_COLHI|nr:Cytochrome P450 [Colletotrichum higginsianum IMI 349063]OBR03065.1 Cytochrome P450 [Colletotrichum higginsianum IMI 349063]TIC91193.1 Isotrichodermin C-15 hydroxylase [Colletotrichum higginsianum]
MIRHTIPSNIHVSSPSDLVWSLGLAIVGFLVLRTVYYLTLHPLAGYPGPLLARITTITSLWHRADGSNHSWPLLLHKRYGHVVRIGPNELSYTHPDAWHDIYAKAGGGGDMPKDFVGLGPDMAAPEKGIVRADDANHQRQRRIFSHAFSDRAVLKQESLVQGHVRNLMRKLAAGDAWDENAEQPSSSSSSRSSPSSSPSSSSPSRGHRVDLMTWLSYLAFDIMGDLMYGEPLGMLESDQSARQWVRDTYATIKTVTLGMAMMGWHPPLGPLLLRTIWGGSSRRRAQHNRFSMDRVDKRLDRRDDDEGSSSGSSDIWSMIMQNSGSGSDKQQSGVITRAEMYSNAATFMIGGTETTTAATSALTYLLLTHPSKMVTLRAELDAAVNNPQTDMTFAGLRKLPYLNACIEEAMRLYPPAPTPMPRIVPHGGRVVCGRFVPAGTRVDIPLYAIAHHPDNFVDPEDFVPERWLDDDRRPARYAGDRLDCVKVFSVGPRDCIGKNLAYPEMRLIMASLLYNFNLELADPSLDWLDQKSYGIWDKHPLWVKLAPRQAKQAL